MSNTSAEGHHAANSKWTGRTQLLSDGARAGIEGGGGEERGTPYQNLVADGHELRFDLRAVLLGHILLGVGAGALLLNGRDDTPR